MVFQEEEKITPLFELLSLSAPLVIGLDKWSFEKQIAEPFFWMSLPFEKTLAQGFVAPDTPVKQSFPLFLAIDLDDVKPFENLFLLKKKAFFASEWNTHVSASAAWVSDIILVHGNTVDFVKKEYRMQA